MELAQLTAGSSVTAVRNGFTVAALACLMTSLFVMMMRFSALDVKELSTRSQDLSFLPRLLI
jgi:hypothetical protein